MPTQKGIVVQIKKINFTNFATIRAYNSEECEICSSTTVCLSFNNHKNKRDIKVINDIGAKIGDSVLFKMETIPFLKITSLIYGSPILSIFIGIFFGNCFNFFFNTNFKDEIPFFFSLILLIGSLKLIILMGKNLANRKKFKPKITKIIRQINTKQTSKRC